MTGREWLAKFNGDINAAIEEREIWFAESGADREADFDPETDKVYAYLLSLQCESPKISEQTRCWLAQHDTIEIAMQGRWDKLVMESLIASKRGEDYNAYAPGKDAVYMELLSLIESPGD